MSSYSDYANAASDILRHKGEALGSAAANKGQIWGGTIANLGQVIPQQVQDVLKDRAEKRKTAQIQQIFQETNGDLEQAIPRVMGIDERLGSQLLKQHTEIKKAVAEAKDIETKATLAKLDLSDRLWGAVTDEDSYARAAIIDKQLGGNPKPQFDPEYVKQRQQAIIQQKLALKPPEDFTLSEGESRFKATGGPAIASVPKAPKPLDTPNTVSELRIDAANPNSPTQKQSAQILANMPPDAESGGSDYAHFLARFAKDKGKKVEDLTTAEELQARKQFGQADDRPASTIRLDSGMTPGQEFSAVRQLHNDYQKETKAAQTMQQQLALMKSSLAAVRKGSMAAGSQGVLVTFQKILDPISVVRESEYARSASGLSLLGRLEGQWLKIQEGGAGVKPEELQKFVDLAQQFANDQKRFADQTRNQIDAMAKKYGLDPSLITKDVAAPNEPATPPPAAPVVKPKNPFR